MLETLDDKYRKVKSIVNSHGVKYLMDEYRLIFDKLIIPSSETRGVFTHGSELYYADDCSLVQCVRLKNAN